MVGSSSADIHLEGKFKIIGDIKEIKNRKKYFTSVKIS